MNIEVTRFGPGGPHQKGIGGLFTNSELQEGNFVDGDGQVSGWANAMPEIADQHVDLLSVALACDLTRMASLRFSTAINGIGAPWLNSPSSGHAVSHAGPSDTSATEQLLRRNLWVAEKLARLMIALDAIPEAEGTVLDHTLIVWANELGEGSVHTHEDIPVVIAGGGGNFRMGRSLELGGVSHGRLLTSLGRAMGLDIDHFGSPNVASDPLTLG